MIQICISLMPVLYSSFPHPLPPSAWNLSAHTGIHILSVLLHHPSPKVCSSPKDAGRDKEKNLHQLSSRCTEQCSKDAAGCSKFILQHSEGLCAQMLEEQEVSSTVRDVAPIY